MTLIALFFACATGKNPPEATPAEAAPAEAAPASAHFGAPFALTETLSAATLLADPAPFVGQTVQVEGRVADVCQKAGCWMVITEGERSMRVLMADHAFAVDRNGAGAACVVEGVVEQVALDPDTVAHLESESARTEVMPEKAAVNNQVFQLIATGVELRTGT